MLEYLVTLFLVLAPVPKDADADVWAWYKNPKVEDKWLGDAEFQRLFRRGVEAGLFACDAGLYEYAVDRPSLRFRRWFLASYRTLPGGGPSLLLPYSTPSLVVGTGVSKDAYKGWDDK